MPRCPFSAVLSLILLLTSTLTAAPTQNILFIVGDDMGFADVGFHGCKDIPTPNLDRLRARGMFEAGLRVRDWEQ